MSCGCRGDGHAHCPDPWYGPVFGPQHELFRERVRDFVLREVAPRAAAWEHAGVIGHEVYRAGARGGLLGLTTPPEYGGAGLGDFRYSAVLCEEFGRFDGVTPAFARLNELVVPHLLAVATDEQRQRWLPGIARGELVGEIALHEPGGDIRSTAERDGAHWILTGLKVADAPESDPDLMFVLAGTKCHGLVSFAVERGMGGLSRRTGTASPRTELVLDRVRVPAGNLLGPVVPTELSALVAREALCSAIGALAGARAVFDETFLGMDDFVLPGVPDEDAGLLVELNAELEIAQAAVNHCVYLHSGGEFAPGGTRLRCWATDLQRRVVEAGLRFLCRGR